MKKEVIHKMRIPLPCKPGKEHNGSILSGVMWYQWSHGIEYTYFFKQNSFNTDFYTTYETNQPEYMDIPDALLEDTFIKSRGYPLKGRGYAMGLKFHNGKIFMEFIITSSYLEHIFVEYDASGNYVKNGEILFPVNWDTEEKQQRILLKNKSISGG